jgi:hypothetical protein
MAGRSSVRSRYPTQLRFSLHEGGQFRPRNLDVAKPAPSDPEGRRETITGRIVCVNTDN